MTNGTTLTTAPIGDGLQTAIWQLGVAFIFKCIITIFTFGLKVINCCYETLEVLFCPLQHIFVICFVVGIVLST